MNERANELIKSIPDLKYDASTGLFETDRRALYDLVENTVKACINRIDIGIHGFNKDQTVTKELCMRTIKQHFGVEE